jgi:hypothetical protein
VRSRETLDEPPSLEHLDVAVDAGGRRQARGVAELPQRGRVALGAVQPVEGREELALPVGQIVGHRGLREVVGRDESDSVVRDRPPVVHNPDRPSGCIGGDASP